MFPDEVERTSDQFSRHKLAHGAQTKAIVAAHRPCEPLLFFDLRGTAVISDKHVIAIY
jgi:hypothetical protein